MTITISQQDYHELMAETEAIASSCPDDALGKIWRYPDTLGQGHYRSIDLRDGVELCIARYQLHDDVVIQSPERSHPLEYMFTIDAESEQWSKTGHKGSSPASRISEYCICGSGLAPVESWFRRGNKPVLEVNVHITPEVFQSFLGASVDLTAAKLGHLVRPIEQNYYCRSDAMTPTMQMVVHQLLHCPFQGITQTMYLESKVWELMALLIE